MSFIDYSNTKFFNESKENWANSKNTFTDKDGQRRYLEFVDDLEKAGGMVDPDIHQQILRTSFKDVFGAGSVNFAKKGLKTKDGRDAYTLIHKKGDPSAIIPMSSITRDIRKSGTMSDPVKEVGFAIAVLIAADNSFRDEQSIKAFIHEAAPNTMRDYLAKVVQGGKKAVTAEALATGFADDYNLTQLCRVALQFLGVHSAKGYVAHFDSGLLDKVRKHGGKLAGFADWNTWNPADIVFIKNGKESALEAALSTETIVEFNTKFNAMVHDGDIIPCSLKNDSKATLGAISTRRYAEVADPTPWDGSKADEMVKKMRGIQDTFGIPVLNTFNKKGIKTPTKHKTTSELLKDPYFINEVKRNNGWNRCYPPMVDWLLAVKKKAGENKLKEQLEIILLESMKSSQMTSLFYLVTPDYCKISDPATNSVDVKAIEFQVNTISVLIHFEYFHKGESKGVRSAQIRSKNSVPQVMSYDSTRGGGETLPLI